MKDREAVNHFVSEFSEVFCENWNELWTERAGQKSKVMILEAVSGFFAVFF